MARIRSWSGAVSNFDDRAGLGEVASDDGSVHPFHCTAIADGSRTIDAGARVSFRLTPGHSGRWEAVELVAV